MSTIALEQWLLVLCTTQLQFLFQPEYGTKETIYRDTVHKIISEISQKLIQQHRWNDSMSIHWTMFQQKHAIPDNKTTRCFIELLNLIKQIIRFDLVLSPHLTHVIIFIPFSPSINILKPSENFLFWEPIFVGSVMGSRQMLPTTNCKP